MDLPSSWAADILQAPDDPSTSVTGRCAARFFEGDAFGEPVDFTASIAICLDLTAGVELGGTAESGVVFAELEFTDTFTWQDLDHSASVERAGAALVKTILDYVNRTTQS